MNTYTNVNVDLYLNNIAIYDRNNDSIQIKKSIFKSLYLFILKSASVMMEYQWWENWSIYLVIRQKREVDTWYLHSITEHLLNII